ncbi:DegT/DnrJ/EryC1/StrS family aminotransferase [Acinetobacter indicus]|uniref:DegT/DnrJ/EryC1/StrS family aminotransferase n=1 Tax=Acinetobacter indicus TaxID=756892 RepID=UPI00143FF288|nr:DegT/DnrJ/EryC1/StrS family aminotransferase [Acinetobacter indicus]QIZ59042.1 DegT/DnrJ/EryC1/StrS family aminotransferase [Acinetobacter indicus]
MIPVTKPYLPSREKLEDYVDGIYERKWLTNNGPLVQELTKRLEKYLGVENLLLVSNGTLALQIAYRTLGVNKVVNGKPAEAITTPFSFIATASSLKWEGINPVFVDIDPETWCLDPNNIESAITPQTRAIVPVHVFGNPCDVEFIQDIADKHDLKIIYDAAHAFDVSYKGQSILKYGDASILSLHATKLFHTIEGGAIIFKRREDLEKAKKLINFGISAPDCIDELGINAKMGEFSAAMGLCVLDEVEKVKEKRKNIWDIYRGALENEIVMQKWSDSSVKNCAYFPIVLPSEKKALDLMQNLGFKNIQLRRYFYPSLESVEVFGKHKKLPISQDISSRILCLPLYPDLSDSQVKMIVELINE